MEEEKILKELEQVLRIFFRNNQLSIKAETPFTEFSQWDSMAHLELITTVEKHFKTRFHFSEAAAIKCAGDIAKLLIDRMKPPKK